MVRMRLTRIGSKKNPIYRVVVADSRSPRDGRFIEIVGRYNPQTDPSTIDLDADKVKDWLAKGAQPSEPGRAPDQGRRHLLTAPMEELLDWIARGLVDDPEAVRVERVDEGDVVVLRLHVADGDVGKVIGRHGRVARALRTLVRSAGVRSDRRLVLEIAD